MKNISSALQNHLDGEVITICRCWIIETKRGTRLGFTDHDEDLELEGVVCHKNAGVEAGSIEERTGLNVNSSDISGALQSEQISETDINAGLYDNARVTTYLVNWTNPSLYTLDRVSLVGEITREDGYYKMELRGLMSQLDQTIGNHFVSHCQARLGDARCKVNLDAPPYSSFGVVSNVASRLIIETESLNAFAGGWFRGGRLTWISGANAGLEIELSEHTRQGQVAVLQLWQAMPHDIAPADAFQIEAGCDKAFATCQAKFSNHLNFRGFPHIPGNDETLTIASRSNVFDGGPLIP